MTGPSTYQCGGGCGRDLDFPGLCGQCAARIRRELVEAKGIDVHNVQMQSIKTPGSSSCLGLTMLVVLSVLAAILIWGG